MKALILVVVALLIAVPVSAEVTSRGIYTTPNSHLTELLNENEYIYHNHALAEIDEPRLVVGAKVDAPNLVRFTRNLTLGLEAGKDLYNDPFMDPGKAIEDDKGYFAYVKVTYTGTFLHFSR